MRCVYCHLDGSADIRIWRQLDIDHLIPKARGGDPDDHGNKVVSCTRCNLLKRDHPIGKGFSLPENAAHRHALIVEARLHIQEVGRRHDEEEDYHLMLDAILQKARGDV